MDRCTLCFRLKNKYGHEKDVPIISLDLKSMDKYTGKYENYESLFNSLPEKIKEFIYKESDDNIIFDKESDMKNYFHITSCNDNDFILLSNNLDVIYITPDELTDLIIKEKMDFIDIEDVLLRSKPTTNNKRRYNFFKYLYDTHVKNKKVLGMMDTYDISKKLPMLKYDDLMIAAIATDKDNIILLTKKIGQKSKDRRNLAHEFKKLYITLDNDGLLMKKDKINERKKDDINPFLENDLSEFEEFIKDYNDEYNALGI